MSVPKYTPVVSDGITIITNNKDKSISYRVPDYEFIHTKEVAFQMWVHSPGCAPEITLACETIADFREVIKGLVEFDKSITKMLDKDTPSRNVEV